MNFSFSTNGANPKDYFDRVQKDIAADDGASGPKLLIAIGGTGAKSLQYLRKQMVERFGAVAFNRMEYLSIDTERASADVQLEGLRGPLEKSIGFDDTERVNLDGTNILAYTQNLNEHPHIKSWWPNSANHELNINLSEGAGQIRPISRLTFFDNLPKIRNAILQKLNTVRKYQSESGDTVGKVATDVYIVAGLSGGTGSGQFIDVAALVRQLGDNVNIHLVLVLPSVFKGLSGTDRLFANGHAALVELNNYLNEPFEVETPGRQKFHVVAGDLFSYCHLLSADNWSTNKLNNRDDMYVAIGEMLYQTIANRRLGNAAKSVRVNRVSWLGGKIGMNYHVVNEAGESKSVEGEVWKTKFSSFGISKFSSKGYSLLSSYRLKFAGEIIDHIAGHGFQNTDTDAAADTYLSLAGVLENTSSSQVISRLKTQVRVGAAAQSLDEQIQNKVQELVDSAPAYAANKNVREAGLRIWGEFERQCSMAEEVHMMGPWFQQLENNKKTLRSGLKNKLIEASDKTYRTYDIRFLLRVLRKSVERLEGTETMPYSILWYEEHARAIEANLEQHRADWEEQLSRGQALADNKQGADLVQIHLEHAARAARQFWQARVDAFAHRKAGEFFKHLRDVLNQNIAQIGQMLQQMSLFKESFESDSRQLATSGQSTAVRSGQLSSEFESSLSAVREQLPQQWKQVEIQFGVASFQNLMSCVFEDTKFEKLVSAAAFHLLSANPEDGEESVAIDHIIAQLSIYETDEFKSQETMVAKVEELLSKAMPWLPQHSGSSAIDAAHQSSIQSDIYVSIPQVEGFQTSYNQLKRIFEERLRGSAYAKFNETDIFFVPSDNKTELVVYTELHAFPIFYLRDLYYQSGSRDYYNQLFIFADEPKSLHVHKDWYMFADVMPLPNFEGYINNLKDLIRAQLLGVVQSTRLPRESLNDHKRYQLAFVYGSKLMPRQIVLGVEKKALQLLENRGDSRIQHLVDVMNERELEFIRLASYTDYCALLNFWLTMLVPPIDAQSRADTDPMPVMMTFALNKMVQHYKEQALREHNGSEDALLEAIAERLVNLSDWTVPICIDKGKSPVPMGQFSCVGHKHATTRFSLKWHENVAEKIYAQIQEFTSYNNQYFSSTYIAGSSSSNDTPIPRLAFNWEYFKNKTKEPATSKEAGTPSALLMVLDFQSGQFVPMSPTQVAERVRQAPQNPLWIQGEGGQNVDARQHPSVIPLLSMPSAAPTLIPYFEYSTNRSVECSVSDIVARIRANPGGQHFIDPSRQQNWIAASGYPAIAMAMSAPQAASPPPQFPPQSRPPQPPVTPAPPPASSGELLHLWNMANNVKFEVPPQALPALLKQFSEHELFYENEAGSWVGLRQCPAALPYLS